MQCNAGHYDVYPAPNSATDGWDTPPFELSGSNGFLYGRGVTDDKGPPTPRPRPAEGGPPSAQPTRRKGAHRRAALVGLCAR